MVGFGLFFGVGFRAEWCRLTSDILIKSIASFAENGYNWSGGLRLGGEVLSSRKLAR